MTTTIPWLVCLWAIGVVFIATRFSIGYFLAKRLVQKSIQPLCLELEAKFSTLAHKLCIAQTVQFYQSANVEVPMVIGWLKPIILIPVSSLTGLPTTQLEAIVIHELAHIRRYDYLINILQTLIETLLFYHPAVWWVSNQIRIERENCCDDIAVEFNGDPLTYAQALVNLEEIRQPQRVVLAANGGILMERIKRLLIGKPKGKNLLLSSFIASLVCLLLLMSSALSMMVSQSNIRLKSNTRNNRTIAIGFVALPIVPKTQLPEDTPSNTTGLLDELKKYQIPALGLPIVAQEPVFETTNTFSVNTQNYTEENTTLMEVEKAFIENENSTETRVNYAGQLLKVNRYEEALSHYLWCYDEGSDYEPEYKTVRLNLLLSHISDFGGNYKPAIDALIERRNKMEEDFLKSEVDDFNSLKNVVLIDSRLEDGSKRSLALFDTLKNNRKTELMATMVNLILDDLLVDNRYKDIVDNSRDISKKLTHAVMFRDLELISKNNNQKEREKTMVAMFDFLKTREVEHTTKYFIALLGVNDVVQARKLAQQIIDFAPSQTTFSLLIEKAEEFGVKELAQELAQEAYKAETETKMEIN